MNLDTFLELFDRHFGTIWFFVFLLSAVLTGSIIYWVVVLTTHLLTNY